MASPGPLVFYKISGHTASSKDKQVLSYWRSVRIAHALCLMHQRPLAGTAPTVFTSKCSLRVKRKYIYIIIEETRWIFRPKNAVLLVLLA